MIAVIFEVFPKSDQKDAYLAMAAEMKTLVDRYEARTGRFAGKKSGASRLDWAG